MYRQGGIWAAQGFLGAPPHTPDRLVQRPGILAKISQLLLADEQQLVAVTGIGGAGKSVLAGQACMGRQVQRAFRDGIVWLEAAPRQDPIVLLATLAHRLGLPRTATGFTTVEQGREQLAAALQRKRLLIVVDNVAERPPLDALTGLAPLCTVLSSTRLAGLATEAGASTSERWCADSGAVAGAAGALDGPAVRTGTRRWPGAVRPGG